ncbi:MAG: glycosyltransferase family 4 protein [Desulfamplus sp.]|nr:glycosyltransferase family 4 protein [Desulfamplus sp.]
MITIDVRWLSASGMGTYLRHIIPSIVAEFPERNFVLIGDRDEIDRIGIPATSKVDVVTATSKMYSLGEQFEMPKKIPKETNLFWATHYNIPLLYRGKMLVTVYDLFHLAMPGLVSGFHKRLYAKIMFGAVRRRAAAIMTISQFSGNELIRLTGKATQSIYPIHLGVADDWFHIPFSDRPYSGKYILYVGNVKPHKNLGSLVKAFGSICDKVPHDLVIVGKQEGFITGDETVAMESLRLGGRVQFTGYVNDETLRQYFVHADAMVFPSLYEGFGLPPLEAMAAGCPVLVSDTGPMPEVCGDAALYCDPHSVEDIAEKMLTLLNDIPLCDSLKKLGIDHARGFTWDRCVQQTCNVIKGLLYQPGEGTK